METARTGFGARLKNALWGGGLGLSFIGITIWFLFWNEGNSIWTAWALSEGAGHVQSLISLTPDPANEGRLVHISGDLALDSRLEKAARGLVADTQAVRLERKVEQFASVEEKDIKAVRWAL